MTALFAVTTFLSAGLLFVVQPMIGKMLLPLLGGVPSVWNTCLVFFQTALLLGYAGAHVGTAGIRIRRQVAFYLAVALPALAVLPPGIDPGAVGSVSPADYPVLWLLLGLPAAVGLPFVALSATGPTLQRWFARAVEGSGRAPYFLYAASNLGSLVALVGYPLLLEPYVSLAAQRRAWAGAYVGVVALVAACGLRSARAIEAPPPPSADPCSPASGTRAAPEPIAAGRRVRWMALAFVPASLLLGVTAFLTRDIATVPLLWIVPLALYLTSFALVFAPRPVVSHHRAARLLPALALLVVLVGLSSMTLPLWLLVPLHLCAFFAAALACHGELAQDRPHPSRLTEYYLLISAGGALGGALNALVAPVLFDRVLEYPLAMALACLLRPGPGGEEPSKTGLPRHARQLDLALPLALGLLAAALALAIPRLELAGGRAGVAAVFGLPAIVCYTFVDRPVRFGLGLVALLLAGQLWAGPHGRPLHEERTFFGVLRVTLDPGGRFHELVHGNTIHGRQGWIGGARDEPLAYYHRSGPAGQLFDGSQRGTARRAVAVVGLGAGSLCAYAGATEEWVFYEVDPAVERIARNETYFTFWRDCRAERRSIVTGDARLRLAESADRRYGLLVIDAFSADAIPVHLVTREALALYRRKTTPDGWIVFHVSSQHLNLEPTLAALARDAGWVAYARQDLVLTPGERDLGKDPSHWVVMARERSQLATLADDARWRPLAARPGAGVWTDDFSSLWSVIKWE